MKLVGGAKIPWSASRRILATTIRFVTRWMAKNKILIVIFSLYYLYIYCGVQWNLCKLRGTEELLTNKFQWNLCELRGTEELLTNKFQWNLCKLRGTEELLTNKFQWNLCNLHSTEELLANKFQWNLCNLRSTEELLTNKFQWNLCKLRSTEELLTNKFDHHIKQPSPWLDDNWTLFWPIKMSVYPWLHLTTMSHGQLTFIDVWRQLVQIGSSKESQRQM